MDSLTTSPALATGPLTQPLIGPVCSHLLRFTSLHDRGRGVAVPCDIAGHVDMDSLSKRLLITYLGARAMVGREYACPTVQLVPQPH